MKIINNLAINYLKKNKKRSSATAVRNYNCNYPCNSCPSSSFKLSRIYDKYR